jgi:hypothetical protein
MSGLVQHMRSGTWVAPTNAYRSGVSRKVGGEWKGNGISSHADLTDAIAAGIVLHAGDAWAYLGRAFDAHLRGDGKNAVHLAYYSELRAAISMLSIGGIAALGRPHISVQATPTGPTCVFTALNAARPEGTHAFVWPALSWWASADPTCSEAILRGIRPEGIPLEDWLDAFGTLATASAKVQDWLATWGLDLQVFGADKDARNYASYEATQLAHRNWLSAPKRARAMREIWLMLEPQGTARFHRLDRYLLRSILRWARSSVLAPADRTAPAFRKRIRKMLDTLGIPQSSRARLVKFLSSATADPPLLALAAKNAGPGDPLHSVQVIARAALLTRVATGMVDVVLHDAGIVGDDLEFWRNDLGERCGLWRRGHEPGDAAETWADVEAGLESLAKWLRERKPRTSSDKDLLTAVASTLPALASAERAVLWGLGL